MTTSYVKEKATGKIFTSSSGQDSNNPIHLEAMNNFVTSRGWSLDDYEVGFADDDVVDGWLDAQEEARKTYADKRKEAYASLQDQADMQYWDAVNETTVWQDHIADVKARFPKS